jgi:hypothetical protein
LPATGVGLFDRKAQSGEALLEKPGHLLLIPRRIRRVDADQLDEQLSHLRQLGGGRRNGQKNKCQ